MPFSVLMSVYEKESVAYFRAAMDSVITQQPMPDEILLMQDGPVPSEMEAAIREYADKLGHRFTLLRLEKNQGLGNALRIGVERARYSLIARMDTDDICVPGRFALQVAYMEAHPEVGIISGQIEEFIHSPQEPVSKREVPCDHEAICEFLKTRSPFNHMAVMFRREAVLAAGNYRELHFMEDYYLWLRMWQAGVRFANLPQTLIYARIGEDMFRRRGGYRYYRSWVTVEKFKRAHGLTGWLRSFKTLAMRFVVLVLLPNRVRGWVLKKFSREKVKGGATDG